MEESCGAGVGSVPEELRCKRSDGKQWRCSAPSMPDKTVCEKHYIQAKKRAASSALRAGLKKKSRRGDDADAELPPVGLAYRIAKTAPMYLPEAAAVPPRLVYSAPAGNAARGFGAGASELLGRTSGLSGGAATAAAAAAAVGGTSCHQCRKGARVVWCVSCDRRGYCGDCISRWYSDIPLDDIRKVCPACRGICNCRVCLQGDDLIKAKVQEISAVDKLRYLHSLLASVLPVLKQIYSDQCFEIGVETRVYGPKTDIPRAKINSDEQMCCDFCKVPIFDYHRHCTRCLYDLCLTCCWDIRRARTNAARGEYAAGQVPERSKDTAAKRTRLESSAERTYDKSTSQLVDVNNIDFRSLFPTWRANNDGSITCGPTETGGCGSSKLVLRRIFKINWIAKLVKSSEEMVNGCKVRDLEKSYSCSCNGNRRSELVGMRDFGLSQCSNRDGIGGNLVYSPVLEDLKYEGIFHFHKHWIKGEPAIIRNAFERSLSSSWDPLSIWRGIQEILEEKMDENVTVKAVDCLDQSEVDIDLNQFIKGYSDGHKRQDGQPLMLKLKDWPPPSVLEEFLLCQRPEFIVNFPLVDFIHSKWGFLNLAAKLPPDALQPEVGSKLLIAYGSHQELGRGDSVTNLKINMGDVVHMLMHTAEVHNQTPKRLKSEQCEQICEEANGTTSRGNSHVPVHNLNLDMGEQSPELTTRGPYEKEHSSTLRFKEKFLKAKVCNGSKGTSTEKFPSSSHSEEQNTDASERALAGALWDVFHRQDVPKLNEYIIAHWEELTASSQTAHSDKHPIYDQALYLDKYHKRILKDQYGIEPWTFRQHIGEAVFIPAGCPFQVKNLQSTVQLALDFLSPESLGESARMAQVIRCLPNDHDAKLKMLEVGKMSLYAASSAVREIQRISLDPNFNLDVRFEDRNLTAAVSENLARITKQRKVACT